jgi:hypothetical protein
MEHLEETRSYTVESDASIYVNFLENPHNASFIFCDFGKSNIWEGSREKWLNKSIYSVSFDISKEPCTDPMAIEVNPFEGKDPRDHPTCTYYDPVTKNPWQISNLDCPYWNPDPFFAGDSQGFSTLNVTSNATAKVE